LDTEHAHCGNVHFAPNSKCHYQWDNNAVKVKSDCDDWYNFPNLKGSFSEIDCSVWDCTALGHLKWWLKHIPKAAGETNGISNNWWDYI